MKFFKEGFDWTEKCRDGMYGDAFELVRRNGYLDFPFDGTETMADMQDDWNMVIATSSPEGGVKK